MIVVCDRCKVHQTEYSPGIYNSWGVIEKKGEYDDKLYLLCPICYAEFNSFIENKKKPAEVCCIDCMHLGIENGVAWCEKKGVVTFIHNSCDDAERK